MDTFYKRMEIYLIDEEHETKYDDKYPGWLGDRGSENSGSRKVRTP